jgi:hypothetical protein
LNPMCIIEAQADTKGATLVLSQPRQHQIMSSTTEVPNLYSRTHQFMFEAKGNLKYPRQVLPQQHIPQQMHQHIEQFPQQQYIPSQVTHQFSPQQTQTVVHNAPQVNIDPHIIPLNTLVGIKLGSHDVNVSASKANVSVNLWSRTDTELQLWIFSQEGHIECADNYNLVWDCGNGQPGALIQLQYKKPSPNNDPNDPYTLSQKFQVIRNGKYKVFQSVLNPMCIIEAQSDTKGAMLVLSQPRQHKIMSSTTEVPNLYSRTHQFMFEAKGDIKTYIPYFTNIRIHDSRSSGLQLNVVSTENIQYLTFGTTQTLFVLTKDNFISLANNPNLVLAVNNGQPSEQVILQTKRTSHNLNQKWLVEMGRYKAIRSALAPNLILHGAQTNGAPIILIPDPNVDVQVHRWDFQTV